MERLERVRTIVDRLLFRLTDSEAQRCGFVHLYGVSATAVLLARSRGLDEELAGVAGMLHDLVTYETGDPTNHGPRSAARIGPLLRSIGGFSDEEIRFIQSAISRHSDKEAVHEPFDELLKDADVLQHDLYDPDSTPAPGNKERRASLRSRLR